MKRSDRCLEIVAIGLGQAGGNIAAELHERGYRALAFNTAQTDLSSLGAGRTALPDSQRIYIGLEGFDGAGSDADYGRECIAAHADAIRDAVKEHTAGADAVLLCAGLGGGTGSCAAEFAAAIEGLALPLVILTTLPHSYESGIAKLNALCGVRDLAKTPSKAWALIDNARLSRLHRDAPLDTYFETINRAIVEPLDAFNRLNDRESAQAIRTLDGEDFRGLLLAGGVVSYATKDLPKLEAGAVLDMVRSSLGDNPMMPADAQLEDVAHLGLVIEASGSALAASPFSLYEKIADQLKRETAGASVYVGLYRRLDRDDARVTVRMIASCPALPRSIDAMLAEAEREAGTLKDKMSRGVPSLDLASLDRLRLTRRPSARGARSKPRPSVVAEAIARETQADSSQRPPQPQMVKVPASSKAEEASAAVSARSATPSTPAAERSDPVFVAKRSDATSEGDPRSDAPLPALRSTPEKPATPAPRPATPTDPSRARYERLAAAFADATTDEKRLYIARELVAAQRSGEALERFYAVNAMARVDPTYFRDALANATKDADPHVADLARRALEKLAAS